VNQRVMEEERNNPHHSTADLLSWSEIRRPDYSTAANRSNQVRFAGQNSSLVWFRFRLVKFRSDYPFFSAVWWNERCTWRRRSDH